jgi:hypothetical protein
MVDVFPVVPQSRRAIIEIDGQRISLKLPVNARVSVPTREREWTGNGTRGPFVRRRWRHVLNWLHILKEARMRIPALAILMIATVLTAAPARAQTYDPTYPANDVWADRCDHATSDDQADPQNAQRRLAEYDR